MYSGSISLAAACPGNTWMPAARNWSSNPFSEENEIVLMTVAETAPPLTSMIETDPTVSGTVASRSASLATRMRAPSGVKVSESGPMPTSSWAIKVPLVSNSATWPMAPSATPSNPTATIPFFADTVVAAP